jgi:uncharacterized protein (TIRG00374 family)
MQPSVVTIFRSKWVNWFVRIAVTLTLLVLILTQVDLSRVFSTLKEIDPFQLIPLIGLSFGIRFMWAWQMSLGLTPLQIEFSVLKLFKVLLISGFYSLVLPGGMVAGGVASLYKLTGKNSRAVEAGALLVYFRMVNTLMVFAIGLFGMAFDQRLGQPALRQGLGIILVFCILGFLPLLSVRVANFFDPLLKWVLDRVGLMNKPKQLIISLWQSLTAMSRLPKRTVFFAFVLAFSAHIMGIVIYWLISSILDLELSIFTLGWIVTFLTVVQLLPLSIGGLGVREVSLVYLLKNYGTQEPQALAFSLILFSLVVVVGAVGGFLEGYDLLKKRRL